MTSRRRLKELQEELAWLRSRRPNYPVDPDKPDDPFDSLKREEIDREINRVIEEIEACHD